MRNNRTITYSCEFRDECLARYYAGESPSAIFRSAGLDPMLVGHKRIERCIARWKSFAERHLQSLPGIGSEYKLPQPDQSDETVPGELDIKTCILIITQQAQCIQRLRREISRLRAENNNLASDHQNDCAPANAVGRNDIAYEDVAYEDAGDGNAVYDSVAHENVIQKGIRR